MNKQHTSYSSAFALGEHAEIRLDRFGSDLFPVARVDGVMLYGERVMYRLSLFVNDGTAEAPNAFLHQGRPVDGFYESDLLPFEGTTYQGEVYDSCPYTNQDISQAKYQIGELVYVAIQLLPKADPLIKNPTQAIQRDYHNIPVLITSVGYEPGKVVYGVSIDREEYRNTPAWDDLYEGRLVRDDLSGWDSMFIQPAGGWLAFTLEGNKTGRSSGTEPNQGNVPRSVDSDKDDGVGYMC